MAESIKVNINSFPKWEEAGLFMGMTKMSDLIPILQFNSIILSLSELVRTR